MVFWNLAPPMGLLALPAGRGPGSKEAVAVFCVALWVLVEAALGEGELEASGTVERLVDTDAVPLVWACSATAQSGACQRL